MTEVANPTKTSEALPVRRNRPAEINVLIGLVVIAIVF
jgi:inositol transport system permease protein